MKSKIKISIIVGFVILVISVFSSITFAQDTFPRRIYNTGIILNDSTIKATQGDRIAYKDALRNCFLDQGYNIKIILSKKYKTTLTLEYCLFNDVWARQIEKSALLPYLQTLGGS